MHDVAMEEFESHLSGNASRAFYDHLDVCAPCRAEVAALTGDMEEISGMLQMLKPDPDTAPQPPLGFHHRVALRIVESQRREAWGLFSPGAAFFRRIAFASLLVLAALGGFLINREASESGTDAAFIMAQYDANSDRPADADRDRLLVTLAGYHE